MRTLLLCSVALLAAACASPIERAADADATRTYLIVRHAEKRDASRDTELSASGRTRAQALADRLAGRDLVAVYATEFKRTMQTVAPAAIAHHLAVTPYPAAQAAADFAAQLTHTHRRGVVLIAGHSNTAPAITAALCACDVSPMLEHEYDRLGIVEIDGDGRARLTVERYGAASLAP